jgi:F0F1-type ATP synthase assembly protein I
MAQSGNEQRKVINTVLTVMVGQVGCLTLAVILVTLLGGLWLDNTFGTKPIFTLVLMFAGIPISIVFMLWIARRTIARVTKPESENKSSESL